MNNKLKSRHEQFLHTLSTAMRTSNVMLAWNEDEKKLMLVDAETAKFSNVDLNKLNVAAFDLKKI